MDGAYYVIDPGLNLFGVLTLEDWLGKMGLNRNNALGAVCSSKTFSPYHSCSNATDEDVQMTFQLYEANYSAAPMYREVLRIGELGLDGNAVFGDAPPWKPIVSSGASSRGRGSVELGTISGAHKGYAACEKACLESSDCTGFDLDQNDDSCRFYKSTWIVTEEDSDRTCYNLKAMDPLHLLDHYEVSYPLTEVDVEQCDVGHLIYQSCQLNLSKPGIGSGVPLPPYVIMSWLRDDVTYSFKPYGNNIDTETFRVDVLATNATTHTYLKLTKYLPLRNNDANQKQCLYDTTNHSSCTLVDFSECMAVINGYYRDKLFDTTADLAGIETCKSETEFPWCAP